MIKPPSVLDETYAWVPQRLGLRSKPTRGSHKFLKIPCHDFLLPVLFKIISMNKVGTTINCKTAD